MANPTADKLKDFGLRHGEKVAMGVVALIFATCTYFAWSRPAIEITPDEVKKNAQLAQAKLSAPARLPDIVKALDESGIKEQGFEQKVDTLQKGLADAGKYRLDKPFVSPEPGAGLIRDMPELLAPEKLYVHAGRGAIRVVVLDAEGNLKPKEEDTKKGSTGKSSTKRAKGAGPLGGMFGNTAKKGGKGSGALAEEQKKKDAEQAERKKQQSIAGIEDAKADADQPEDAGPALSADQVETALHGQRFATLVGRFDHKKQKELFAKALKDPSAADPHYVRLEMERRERLPDNSWSKWAPVNRDKFNEVNDVLSATEAEVAPADAQISTLIDRLPFLEVGYWVGAHHVSFAPKTMLKPKEDEAKAKSDERSKSGSGIGGMNKSMGKGDYDKMGKGGPGGGGNYGAGMGAGGGGFSPLNLEQSGRGGAGGGAPAGGDYEKANGEAIMVRGLDYDVQPDAVYQYRVRIIYGNPNLGWVSVSPGVDNKSKELPGPWSEATAEVGIPADVSTYAVGRSVGSAPGEEKFDFQVVAWNEQDGYTVVHKFDPSPGQIIGQKIQARVPDDKKGEGTTSKPIDFTSHQILADALGGDRPAAEIQPLGVPRIEVPMLALVVRADGVLVVRDQAQDAASGEMAEMKAIYDQIMKDAADTKKKTSNLAGGAGGYGGFGGMGAGGMGGAMGAN